MAWVELLWQICRFSFFCKAAGGSLGAASPPRSAVGRHRSVAALLTLPIGGIAINLADQYLHPRTLATAAILAAIVAVTDRRLWRAGFLLAVAFLCSRDHGELRHFVLHVFVLDASQTRSRVNDTCPQRC